MTLKHGNGRPVPSDKRAKIIELYRHLSARNVAAIVGNISHEGVLSVIKAAGLKVRKRGINIRYITP